MHLTVLDGDTQRNAARGLFDTPRPPVWSLYVHMPFCFHKCHYCDFYSIVDKDDRQDTFADRLIEELRTAAPMLGSPLQTIFVGGGTPTLLRADLWRRLLGAMRELLDLSAVDSGVGEFTVECNPETLTEELAGVLREGGVGRLSIGAQSFDPALLRTLERWHEPENVGRAVRLARAAGIGRVSLDLIYAIPGQSLDGWSWELDTALALEPDHLSCYALTYEPNTAMSKRLELGRIEPADEDLEADMHELTIERLARAGLARYEISNFARDGEACRHNLAYWRQEQWAAVGPSASGHLYASDNPADGSHRYKNAPKLSAYLASGGGPAPISEHEPPDALRLAREMILTGVRLAEGVQVSRVGACVPESSRETVLQELGREAEHLINEGLLVDRRDTITCTDRGFLLADTVASRLMRALER